MQTMRQVIADRSSGGVLGVLLAVALALQALAAMLAPPAAAATHDGPGEVLCMPGLTGDTAPTPHNLADCCIGLCQSASTALAGLPPGAPILASVAEAEPPVPTEPARDATELGPSALPGPPRGPPASP